MVDIATHLVTHSRLLPKLGIGTALLAMTKDLGGAFEMAYVTPYETIATARRPPLANPSDLQRRDPNW
ncbi:hypothetical protein EOA13_35300 [Mesorhizobium sp. M7A.F.Ca.US.011.01.1.1]|uniref:hypothetical protein n=1 Tax=unclassified Mesorhizobium TaxID=325217 RepID=UPI000FCC7A5F|nr:MULTISPECIES: hypothetical protein [unclassified Mesorhizobium]RUW86940.1 hypothetical protein EOA19_34015 [Mesorhizobium sp. M7A.F.Ca.US.010.02.1.1]RUX22838.1 hypothetical protein EOA13_35300 [Mesorhizobium sp. M7A.F.Ca.US.011.01.1.1]